MVLQAPAWRPPVTMKSQGTVWSLSVPERYCRSVVWAEAPAGAVRIKAVKRSLRWPSHGSPPGYGRHHSRGGLRCRLLALGAPPRACRTRSVQWEKLDPAAQPPEDVAVASERSRRKDGATTGRSLSARNEAPRGCAASHDSPRGARRTAGGASALSAARWLWTTSRMASAAWASSTRAPDGSGRRLACDTSEEIVSRSGASLRDQRPRPSGERRRGSGGRVGAAQVMAREDSTPPER